MAINNRTVQVTTTPVPADVTVNASDFRAFVDGASRVITSYTAVSATEHQLQLATPVFAVGDTICIDGFQDVGSSATVEILPQTNVVAIAEQDDVLFGTGTAVSEVIANLPAAVQVTLQDETVRNLGVTNWSSATYNSNVPGTYLFTGDLVLVHNVTNTLGLQAEVNVLVSDAVFTGIITDVSSITMEFNNNPAETFQVATTATEVLAYLDDAATRTALPFNTATVFLDGNNRIIRLLDITLKAGETDDVDFENLATANAPANLKITGRDGSSVLGTAGNQYTVDIAGDMLTIRNVLFRNVDLYVSGNDNTILDSRVTLPTVAGANLDIDGNRNTFDSVDIVGDLNIATSTAVNGLAVNNSTIRGSVDLATGAGSQNVNFNGGRIVGSAAGNDILATNAAGAVTIDGTAIGTEPINGRVDVDIDNTVGLTIMNTAITGTIDEASGVSGAQQLTLQDVVVFDDAFATGSALVMNISGVSFRGETDVRQNDAVFTGCEFRGTVDVPVTGIQRTVFEDSTFNVTGGAFDVDLNAIDQVVTFRGTTTAMSASANVVSFVGGTAARLVRLEGVIEGNERLQLQAAATDRYDFRAGLIVNDTHFDSTTTVNGATVTLAGVTTDNGDTLTIAGPNASVSNCVFESNVTVAVTAPGAVFNATEFVSAANATILALNANGAVFNNSVIEADGAAYTVTMNGAAADATGIFNNTAFRLITNDVTLTGPGGAPGEMIFNNFTTTGVNNVVVTANTGVVLNP